MNTITKSAMDSMNTESNQLHSLRPQQSNNQENKEEEKWGDWSCSSFECDDSSLDSMSNEELDDILRSIDLEINEIEHSGLDTRAHKYEQKEIISKKIFHNIPVSVAEEECENETSLTKEEMKLIQEASSNIKQRHRHIRCIRNQKLVC
mmetsp:Transcript_28833/g.42086  ORF Transcript_28833/g.42086 Transcript_28833/m.42086 type:complete len:149 (-) Transcript_28833:59-505(-)